MRPSRPPSAWLLPFALAALLARPAFADEPSLAATPDTLRADEQGSWNTTATLHNPLAVGLFPDSLCVDLEDGDPGVPSGPRAYTLREDAMAGAMGAIGGGEDHTFSWMLAAPFERGGVTLRLHLHDHDGHAFVVRHTLVADGGPLSDSLPSTFATAGGRRVEVVLAAPRGAAGPAPGLLIVPGEDRSARGLLRLAWGLSHQGWAVALVSRPGHGQSDGPADMMGPATVAALGAALDRLEAMPGVDRARVGAWGVGRGGTAALLLAAQRPELRAVVAQSALYDLWASYRDTPAAERAAFAAEAGPDSAGWRARSPLAVATGAKAAVLVLHGERDPGAPVPPVDAYVAARRQLGLPTQVHFVMAGRRMPPLSESAHDALAFLHARLAP